MDFAARLLIQAVVSLLHNLYAEEYDERVKRAHDELQGILDNPYDAEVNKENTRSGRMARGIRY